MAIAFKSGVCFLHSSKPQIGILHASSDSSSLFFKRLTPIAVLSISSPTLGLVDTSTQLKRQGKVVFIPYITVGDPNISTTAEALKVLDACGSDIIELGVPYSGPLADGPLIQVAATRSLEKWTNLDNILDMLDKGFVVKNKRRGLISRALGLMQRVVRALLL